MAVEFYHHPLPFSLAVGRTDLPFMTPELEADKA